MKNIGHKNINEKIRKERIIFFNKTNNLSLNGASVYAIVEFNNKLFIFNSRPDKDWVSLDIVLVSTVVRTRIHHILTAERRDTIRFQNEFS